MRVVVSTAPTGTPVSLTEAKRQLRVDHTDDDTLITDLINVAAVRVGAPHGLARRSLCSQGLTLSMACWPRVQAWPSHERGRTIRLPGGPVTAVASVTYSDTNNDAQTVDSGDYWLASDYLTFADDFDAEPLYARPDAVRIVYTAGYATAADIPATLRQAVLLVVSYLYAHRGDMVLSTMQADPMIDQILAPYRLMTI